MSVFEKTPSQPEDDQEIIGEFPCTQTQLRCWILNQLNPGNPGLNVAVRWEIRGNFKAATLEAAFRKIIQRHEVLRTRIIERAIDILCQGLIQDFIGERGFPRARDTCHDSHQPDRE